ncbi:hypothetical protein VOLCADRAFT_99979 [Volvox carteri f. nagariensis]|uniref:Uncharacterized protein n=1 Tax=Volvox carteri f. nagariensis TaxID=3068 RepID=D8UJ47_VOLCA|nr:uncharacterized protein VOLCADRAFT_99979 [Volvox carteri f. nagariensis]EFJ40249.1 hypothetical protein VOLCADRAFT_99979 [Volvox carteri f. nagariensis]|eukprot:XP_002958689.1 hypothetical protein VOLCADRAFT_99979 [Volvox carteri f. nagariensis]
MTIAGQQLDAMCTCSCKDRCCVANAEGQRVHHLSGSHACTGQLESDWQGWKMVASAHSCNCALKIRPNTRVAADMWIGHLATTCVMVIPVLGHLLVKQGNLSALQVGLHDIMGPTLVMVCGTTPLLKQTANMAGGKLQAGGPMPALSGQQVTMLFVKVKVDNPATVELVWSKVAALDLSQLWNKLPHHKAAGSSMQQVDMVGHMYVATDSSNLAGWYGSAGTLSPVDMEWSPLKGQAEMQWSPDNLTGDGSPGHIGTDGEVEIRIVATEEATVGDGCAGTEPFAWVTAEEGDGDGSPGHIGTDGEVEIRIVATEEATVGDGGAGSS